MPPPVALLLCFVLLLALLRYDPAKDSSAARALWVPVIWLLIAFSRLPSQWLGTTAASAEAAMEDGNWLDRGVYLVLMLLAIRVLALRSLEWHGLVARNVALAVLLSFALISVAWSDFPSITLKRWIRDLGCYLIVFVILSDPRPVVAIDTVIRRLCYILVPFSIVLVKYYPGIGVGYDAWSGTPVYRGVATSKNGLGVLCLVSGIFFFWDILRRWSGRPNRTTRRTLLVDAALIGMTLWLLRQSQSATSQLCLLIGCVVIAAAHTRSLSSRPMWLKTAIPASICLFLALEFSVGVTDLATAAFGRDSSMTGRTDLWEAVLPLNPNPLFGAGYGSFWLGDRLSVLWTMFRWRPNQAHNGYLEVYLSLGLVGLLIFGIFLMVSYQRIWRSTNTAAFRSLSLAIWVIMLLYNVTEAAVFAGHLWALLLLGSVVVPGQARDLGHFEAAHRRSQTPVQPLAS